jgi:hypothetical protein
VDDFKIRKLRWPGNIIRLEDEGIPIEVLNGKFHNKSPVGKQRT